MLSLARHRYRLVLSFQLLHHVVGLLLWHRTTNIDFGSLLGKKKRFMVPCIGWLWTCTGVTVSEFAGQRRIPLGHPRMLEFHLESSSLTGWYFFRINDYHRDIMISPILCIFNQLQADFITIPVTCELHVVGGGKRNALLVVV